MWSLPVCLPHLSNPPSPQLSPSVGLSFSAPILTCLFPDRKSQGGPRNKNSPAQSTNPWLASSRAVPWGILWKQPRVEPSQAQTVYESSSKIRLSLKERRGGELSTAIPSLVLGLQLKAFLKSRNANLRHCSVSFLHPQRDQVTDTAGPLLPPIPTSDFENTNTYEITPQCSGFFFFYIH